MIHVRSHLSTDVVLAGLFAAPVHAESLVREARPDAQPDEHDGEQPGGTIRGQLDEKHQR